MVRATRHAKPAATPTARHRLTAFRIVDIMSDTLGRPRHGGQDMSAVAVYIPSASAAQWAQFAALDTEMIVTKTGRRMFPCIHVGVSGLDAARTYSVYMAFACTDGMRYKYAFRHSKWVVAGPGDAESPPRTYRHGDTPTSGRQLMARDGLLFDKLKLTNNQLDDNGFMILNSMHRYTPRVTIVAEDAGAPLRRSFDLPSLMFTAVTAYQNQSVTQLKIAMNPFAKGFRDGGDAANNDLWNATYHMSALHQLNCLVMAHYNGSSSNNGNVSNNSTNSNTNISNVSNNRNA